MSVSRGRVTERRHQGGGNLARDKELIQELWWADIQGEDILAKLSQQDQNRDKQVQVRAGAKVKV